MKIEIGEQIVKQVTLLEEDIISFAKACGDMNPLHHDRSYAEKTRFGGLIASGPHLSSMLMGMLASHFTREAFSLGLEFDFKFRGAVPAHKPLTLTWKVIAVTPKPSLNGDLVELTGNVTNAAGQILIAATSKCVVMDTL
jgi:acyl dehydratase